MKSSIKAVRNKKILKVVIVTAILLALSVGIYFICRALGVTNVDTLREIIGKTGIWGIATYIGIRVLVTVLLCFIPGTSMIFDLVSVALYGATLKAFIISIISISIASVIMYLLGRFGANKLLEKLIGKDDLDKANDLIKEKGLVFYPIMMACGGFPDDALVCIAGVIKMNFIYFLIATVIGRAIGCATSTFAIALFPFKEFTTFYDWFVFICCIAILAYFIIKGGNLISNKLNKYLENKHEKKR